MKTSMNVSASLWLASLGFVYPVSSTNSQVGVNNDVEGDQTVGGVHLFELHTPEGGVGMGIKILIVMAVVLLVLYWCCLKKVQSCKETILPYAEAAIAAPAALQQPHLQQPQLQCRCHQEDEL